MKTVHIALLPGDGIGPEVVAEGVKVLRAAEKVMQGVWFETTEYAAGAAEYRRSGDPFPEETFQQVSKANAILLGAMGLPDVRLPNGTEIAPQLDLRERLELYAGLRPVKLYHQEFCSLKGYQAGEIDLLIVRENTEGMFWSRKAEIDPQADEIMDSIRVSRKAVERVVRVAFRQAQRRRHKVTLIDKSNVLPSMAFFRRVFDEVSHDFPDVEPEKIYIDAAALYFVRQPHRFDVVVTENMFGDILSDLGAGLVGGMGMAPSADAGERQAVFQPAHGSAPDIAGKGIANPIATILSVAMMLDWLGRSETKKAARRVFDAVEAVLADPANRTPDLGGKRTTAEMGDQIAQRVLAD